MLLTWSAPYTLKSVPITGYIIDTQNTHIVNTTEYIYRLAANKTADPCISTSLSVSAVNDVGIGDINIINFYYKTGKTILVISLALKVQV